MEAWYVWNSVGLLGTYGYSFKLTGKKKKKGRYSNPDLGRACDQRQTSVTSFCRQGVGLHYYCIVGQKTRSAEELGKGQGNPLTGR